MIGTRIGQYEITAELGAGGMGVVWQARDTLLGRTVAVKSLPPELARDPERLERFRREARAIAALDHPNIVTVHGLEEKDGWHFLVMERVEGDTLDRLVPAGGMALAPLLEVGVPMADALAAAHDKGIVHRDVKPGNVMVTHSGRVKLLDFGLAKVERRTEPVGAEDATRTADLTRAGALMGTAPYMSPEQIQGQEVDARSDVFSLGVVLYEMATGGRPFRADNLAALASSILRDVPAPIEATRADLPRQLGRILEACLAKDPDRRLQTARDVRNQLEALRREEASAPAGRAVASPAEKRSRARWWLAAGLAAAIAGAGGYVASRRLEDAATGSGAARRAAATGTEPERLMLAVLPFENLGAAEDAYFTDGIGEEIRGRLATLEGLGVISRTTARRFKGERPTLEGIADELDVDYIVEGTVRWQTAPDGTRRVRVTPQLVRVADDVQVWTASYDAVLADVFDLQSDVARQVAERLDLELYEPRREALARRPTTSFDAYDAYLRAEDAFERGKELESRDTVLEAVAHYQRAVTLDPAFAVAHARLAQAAANLFLFLGDRSEQRLQAGRDAAARALEIDPALPEARYALGMIRMGERDRPAALAEFEEVTRIRPNYAEAYWASSMIHTVAGAWEQSFEDARKATELNPRAARHFCQMGGMSQAMGKYDDAVLYHDRSIQVEGDRACPYYCQLEALVSSADVAAASRYLETLPAHVDRDENPSINYYGVVVDTLQGRYQDALARLETGSAEAYEAPWQYRPKRLFAAIVHGAMGRPELAKTDFEAAQAQLEPLVAARRFDPRLHSALSIVHAGLGRRDDAIREVETTLKLIEGTEGLFGPYLLRELAHARVLLGDHDEALRLLERHLSLSGYLPAAFLRIEPIWAPLRADPRFEALLDEHAGGYRSPSSTDSV